MTETIEVYCENPAWHDAAPDLEPRLRQAALTTLTEARDATANRSSLTILLTDDEQMRALNRAHRGKDIPTNVLSFPSAAGGDYLGDIAIALATAEREAEASNKPLLNHVLHLAVHGVLHLLGYDHDIPAEAETMEAREVEILSQIGVPDPYRQPDRVT
ncbi:MAG: rRNA maturation RNase YbeY [Alphaproteobacteria bacterium]|nr:rRNA maturation RNase YbeY [Alphaproteobacteria bacterium]